MASIDREGNLRGNINRLTYRRFNGKNIVQGKPGKGRMKQTEKTKASSIDFALGSNRAKILREILFPMIRGMQDRGMVNRFTAAVGAVLRSNTSLEAGYRDLEDGDLELLNGFEFNTHSPFSKMFGAKLSMGQNYLEGIKISMEAFRVKDAINFPPQASGCTLRVLIAAISLPYNEYQYFASVELDIAAGTAAVPAHQWNFIKNIPEDCLFAAACSLDFYEKGLLNKTSLNSKLLNPVALVGLIKGLDFEEQPLDLEEDISTNWNIWQPITGIDGNKLRKR